MNKYIVKTFVSLLILVMTLNVYTLYTSHVQGPVEASIAVNQVSDDLPTYMAARTASSGVLTNWILICPMAALFFWWVLPELKRLKKLTIEREK